MIFWKKEKNDAIQRKGKLYRVGDGKVGQGATEFP